MYVNVSRYKRYHRVRLLRKVVSRGKRQTVLVEHIGSARNESELVALRHKAHERLAALRPQLSLLTALDTQSHRQATDTSRLVVSGSFARGLWQVLGGLYDDLGLPATLLKQLVLARIALPQSKRATARYLENAFGLSLGLQTIYDYLDTVDKEEVMTTLLAAARQRLVTVTGQVFSVVFYDVTTLYFETDEDDEDTEQTAGLRKKGYSKDHRFDLPQIVVGLTVDQTGFPLDFQVYEGNTYEGHTLLAGVTKIREKLKLTATALTVVADAGMLSDANLAELEQAGYTYIVGARIRSVAASKATEIVDWDYATQGVLDTQFHGRRLLVTYSDKRAQCSRQNRDRLIAKLQVKLDRGLVVKKSKYVHLTTDAPLTGSLDQAKIDADRRFDGLKGYVTNTTLTPDEVMAHYGNLWRVEQSFRMSKSDLKARPTFHYKRERIIAHLVICVCALGVLRAFEEQVYQALPGVGVSLALEQLLAIREYRLTLPNQQQIMVPSELTDVQHTLMGLHAKFGRPKP
mgnify:FL=1